MTQEQRDVWAGRAVTVVQAIAAALLIGLVFMAVAHAHEWSSDSQTQDWFEGLRQPDAPRLSCCGESDSYWADSYEVEGDHYVAIITDTRDDKLPPTREYPMGRTRAHLPLGTHIAVPNPKIKWDKGNPTGHGIIFMPTYDHTEDPETGEKSPAVPYCFLPPEGV